MVLEKILENPLDSKEIKSVNPQGNQTRTFIERTDAEAEAPIFGVKNLTLQPLDGCSQLGTLSWVLPLPQTGDLCLKGKFHYSCTSRFCYRWDWGLGLLILPT